MAEAPRFDVKVLKHCKVGPPPGSVPSASLPLTFFDIPWLLCPPIQRIFFYDFPYSTHYFLQTFVPPLQHSLSLALLHFFPFSANLLCPPPPLTPHFLYIDDHDSLPFTVAESTANFPHLIAHHPRHVQDLHPFLPELATAHVLEDGTRVVPLMAIQVTVLSHSGFSIGITFRHVAADGMSFHHFMKSWASICRTGGCLEEESKPCYNRDELKHSNELLVLNFLEEWWNWVAESEKHTESGRAQIPSDKVRATMVLDGAQIQRLKNWASVSCREEVDAPYLSTFVVTCALIWACLLKSEESIINFRPNDDDDDDDDDKVCYFVLVADCRNRCEFCIPSTYFGNCLALWFVRLKRKELVGERGVVEAVKAIGNKIKEMKEGGLIRDAERWMVNWKEAAAGKSLVTVAGSPKLGVYQTDFGWGRPKKSEVVHVERSGVISIGESRDEEGGVEVGLALPRLQMDSFESILKQRLEAEKL